MGASIVIESMSRVTKMMSVEAMLRQQSRTGLHIYNASLLLVPLSYGRTAPAVGNRKQPTHPRRGRWRRLRRVRRTPGLRTLAAPWEGGISRKSVVRLPRDDECARADASSLCG